MQKKTILVAIQKRPLFELRKNNNRLQPPTAGAMKKVHLAERACIRQNTHPNPNMHAYVPPDPAERL